MPNIHEVAEEVPPWEETGVEEADPALIWRDLRAIQHTMWNYVGLVRSERRLTRALRDLRHLKEEIDDFYRASRLTDGLVGLRHAVQAALLVAEAAYHNRQSRGCHYREQGTYVQSNDGKPGPLPDGPVLEGRRGGDASARLAARDGHHGENGKGDEACRGVNRSTGSTG
ncbi:MAG: hypothetical protein N2556_07625 [Anaerolineae bacterium]|nr:hypothetical protein [Anaerolineae bacterium]